MGDIELTRPIIGIENRTPQEVFDIMCDRIARSGLEARKAEVGMRERAALEAEEYHVHSVAAAIRALPLTEGGDTP